MPEAQAERRTHLQQNARASAFSKDRIYDAAFVLLLALSIATWFVPIRRGLTTDETGSYWQIYTGFSQIWPRGLVSLCFPAYTYILWLATKVLGTSEIALRIPSILAMLGAVYLLYLAACELFNRNVAILAVTIFCIHPIVLYAAIDVRPYAFGILATNAAILALLRLRNNDSDRTAALFGLLTVSIVYFHYLFAVMLPAFAVCFFLIKTGDRKVAWRQFGVATVVIAVGFLPLIPGLEYLFRTKASHVYERAPLLSDIAWTLLPWQPRRILTVIVVALLLLSAVRKGQGKLQQRWQWLNDIQPLLVCASLALIPLSILFGVSALTSIHMFDARHRLIAIPGIALCWGFIFRCFRYQQLALLFCAATLISTTSQIFVSPDFGRTRPTFKHALEAAQENASSDYAPVVFCSSFAEGDYEPMPSPEAVKDNSLFAPLSYYKLNVPVYPLPKSMNLETVRLGSKFLEHATQIHQRFLAVGEPVSYTCLNWLSQNAPAFDVRTIGTYEGGVKLLEFTPKAQADARQ